MYRRINAAVLSLSSMAPGTPSEPTEKVQHTAEGMSEPTSRMEIILWVNDQELNLWFILSKARHFFCLKNPSLYQPSSCCVLKATPRYGGAIGAVSFSLSKDGWSCLPSWWTIGSKKACPLYC
jgi:hypothetical protein